MYKIRRNNNIVLTLSVYRGEDPEDFSQASHKSCWLEYFVYPNTRVYPSFTIVDNKVIATINGSDVDKLGKWRFYLSYSKINMELDPPLETFEVDVSAFEIVQFSEQQKLTNPESNVNLEVVDLDVVLDRCKDGINGASAFELWLLEEGNEGKTYNDYKAWLQSPAQDFIDGFNIEYNDGTITINY
jgi:hypothetical protein